MWLANRTWGAASNPVALLLHGGNSSSEQWTELGRWLSRHGWHAVAVDLRGHGDSPVDAATMASPSLALEADDLVETVAAVRPDVTDVGLLLGFSYGAIVSLVCSARHPIFARRMVLLEPGGRESSDRAQFAAEKRARSYLSESSRDYAIARHEMFSDVDIVDLAARCAVPTLVVLGRDKETPLGENSTVLGDLRTYSALIGEERRRFCSALRLGETRVLPTGHSLDDQTRSGLLGVLGTWLAETVPTEPGRPDAGRKT
jgi:pimeloyl-ACP methyl ester carboxylesterase